MECKGTMSDELETPPEPREIGKHRDKIVNGPIIHTLVWLGAPPLVNQLVVVTYNVADTYWILRFGGWVGQSLEAKTEKG
ncbi:MAG: hypothetical protein QXK98_07405 [Candidatus Bathyarchaeia archaeon]